VAKNASILRIRQIRGRIGQTRKQREGLQTLGLRRIGQVVERPDNAAVRGTVRAIAHLVRVEGYDGVVPMKPSKRTPTTAAAAAEKPKTAAVENAKQAEAAAVAETAPKATKKKTTTKKKATKKKATKKTAARKTAAKKTTKKKAKTAKKKASGDKS
jgi:ribosomal protein L30